MKVLGIIPARGGSKGVPGKNIKQISGIPLITYSINSAKESKRLTKYVIATDCAKIADIAWQNDTIVHNRSITSATDHSPVVEVVLEVINSIQEDFDLILLLQPTAPIRDGYDIDNVISMFNNDSGLENVVSVVELQDIHPGRMYYKTDSNKLNSLNPDDEKKRRQELNPVYIRNGSIYAITTAAFLREKQMILSSKKAYVMPEYKWANIDTERDFKIAETMINEWKKFK